MAELILGTMSPLGTDSCQLPLNCDLQKGNRMLEGRVLGTFGNLKFHLGTSVLWFKKLLITQCGSQFEARLVYIVSSRPAYLYIMRSGFCLFVCFKLFSGFINTHLFYFTYKFVKSSESLQFNMSSFVRIKTNKVGGYLTTSLNQSPLSLHFHGRHLPRTW